MRVAIVHYWFLNRRGGERVVEALCELFPQADLFALVADRNTLTPELQKHKLATSFLQHLPGSRKWHRHMLPLYPLAVEQFDLRGYDLVISSESGPAKGVITGPETCHLCYCHTPMRYIWNLYQDYKNGSGLGPVGKLIFGLTAHYLRLWDQASGARVDYFAANSHHVAARIRKYYRREAEVIHPPVDVCGAAPGENIEDYYLVVGQLVNYKRVDLAIAACNRLGRTLRIVGAGRRIPTLAADGGEVRQLSRRAFRPRGARTIRAVPCPAVPGRRGLRHCARGSAGLRAARAGVGQGRGSGNCKGREWKRAAPSRAVQQECFSRSRR